MNATTVAVDLAKNVFELAVADGNWKVIERARLTRSQFERWFDNRDVSLIVMEACGSAHHWGRVFRSRGIEVRLLHAQYVRAYVKRNKTDAADAAALLEAARAEDIKPVAVKSVEQQALQALHRTREGWKSTRTRRINTLRGFCREFGLVVPEGAATGIAQMARYLADEQSGLPAMLRSSMRLMLDEIRLMEARMAQLEAQLGDIAKHNPACQVLLTVPGIGLITSTAMVRGGQSGQLRLGAALCELPRAHAAGILFGQQPLSGTYFQEGGPLYPHTAHPWGTKCIALGHGGAPRRARDRPVEALGAGGAGAHQSQ
jgi:transposase